MTENQKNTPTIRITKSSIVTAPPKNPPFANFKKPIFNSPKFSNNAFRTQNRGGK